MRLLLLLLLFCSCEKERTPMQFSGNAMTMEYRVQIGDPVTDKAKIHQLIQETFSDIDNTFNSWNPNSELSKLNQMQAGEKKQLSKKLEAFLLEVDRVVALTNGRFDPTVLPVKTAWIQALEAERDPPTLNRDIIGWDKITIQDHTFSKRFIETTLDLSGIVKGYAIDCITEKLSEAGYKNTYVEWGGEIRCQGSHPSKRAWRVQIRQINQKDITLDLVDQAVATSGNYLQIWKAQDDTLYTHIIDPKTLTPLQVKENSIASVTVVAKTAALADALATTLMLFQDEKSARLWLENVQEEHPDVQAWILKKKE